MSSVHNKFTKEKKKSGEGAEVVKSSGSHFDSQNKIIATSMSKNLAAQAMIISSPSIAGRLVSKKRVQSLGDKTAQAFQSKSSQYLFRKTSQMNSTNFERTTNGEHKTSHRSTR